MLALLNAPEEFAPPVEILHHHERLKEHFERVKRNAGGSGQEEIAHDPSVNVSAAAEYRRKNGLPPL